MEDLLWYPTSTSFPDLNFSGTMETDLPSLDDVFLVVPCDLTVFCLESHGEKEIKKRQGEERCTSEMRGQGRTEGLRVMYDSLSSERCWKLCGCTVFSFLHHTFTLVPQHNHHMAPKVSMGLSSYLVGVFTLIELLLKIKE